MQGDFSALGSTDQPSVHDDQPSVHDDQQSVHDDQP